MMGHDGQKPRSLAFFSLVVLLQLFSADFVSCLYGPSSDVLQLNPSNFRSKVVDAEGIVLVEFFAPWCGHCKALAPAWEKAATALKGIATVAAIDCDEHSSIAQEYGIKGFPTIKVFSTHADHNPTDYTGAREAKAIVDFGLSQVKGLAHFRLGGGEKTKEPSHSVVLTDDSFDEKVLQSNELWLVEFFAPWCGHCKKLAPEWKRAAKSLKGRVNLGQVDCTVEQELAKRYEIKGFPTILVFGQDKQQPEPYEGGRTATAIESHALELLEKNVPEPEVLEVIGQETLDKCTAAPICFLAFLPHILDSKAEGRQKYLDVLSSTASKFKRSFYGYAWAEAGAHEDLETTLGVGGYGYPAVVALNAKKKVYAPFKSALEDDHFSEFVRLAARGGRGNLPVEDLPPVKDIVPWDGQDAQLQEEEEFSLDELMADEEEKSEKSEL
eukprot:TRINITY_DN35_c0_g1_i5.p1 TRINITY_DN35_c0_g1~~TRINITY_DN35_c0_g1_i5.p1  ORF type:complete len:440 (-),score=150.18 TRINITY_DN35_c0_g1_i5:181-1500(-)